MRNLVLLAALSTSLISTQTVACEKGGKDKSKLEETEASKQSKESKKDDKKQDKVVLKEKNPK